MDLRASELAWNSSNFESDFFIPHTNWIYDKLSTFAGEQKTSKQIQI